VPNPLPRGVEAFELITIKKDKEKYFGEKSCSSKSALKLPIPA